MAGASRYSTAIASFALVLCGAAADVHQHSPDHTDLHEALAALEAGRPNQAERIALELADKVDSPSPRAWLVAAAARRRLGRFEEAVEAYKQFLGSCDSMELRHYVVGRIEDCRTAMRPRVIRKAPSKRLTPAELRELAAIDWVTHVESTEHTIVRSRNSALSKLVATEAEAALARICGDLLDGQEYPHSIDIYVWTTREEYLANSPSSAPEWSDGSFSISYSGDIPTRRVDLTQLDADGRFAAIMIDRILPHEMCHIVVKEYFGDAPCPTAINEGLAMLAEAEIDSHRVMLAGKALMGKAKIPLDTLVTAELKEVSSKEVFYAESFSFLEYLHSRMTRRQFKALLDHIRAGCEVSEAIQRALYLPSDDSFVTALAAAWQEQAIADWQMLEAVVSR